MHPNALVLLARCIPGSGSLPYAIAEAALQKLEQAGYALVRVSDRSDHPVTAVCHDCRRTLQVPVEVFNSQPVARCADAGLVCEVDGQ